MHKGAMIHKVTMRRCGHKGGTKGAHQAVTDAHVSSVVRVGERHVIDRGDKTHSPH